jgi:hypothetical protein
MIFISVRLNKDKVDVAEAEELSKKLIFKKLLQRRFKYQLAFARGS